MNVVSTFELVKSEMKRMYTIKKIPLWGSQKMVNVFPYWGNEIHKYNIKQSFLSEE